LFFFFGAKWSGGVPHCPLAMQNRLYRESAVCGETMGHCVRECLGKEKNNAPDKERG